MSKVDDPASIHAVIVGIEEFDLGPEWNQLKGCISAARRFADWVCKPQADGRRVPAGNVHLLLSPKPAPDDPVAKELENVRPATFAHLNELVGQLKSMSGSVLLLVWMGHGDAHGKDRRVFLSDSRAVQWAVSIEALCNQLGGASFPRQLAIFDTCAVNTTRLPAELRFETYNFGTSGPVQRQIDQYVLFACWLGGFAEYSGIGTLSRTVLERLEQADISQLQLEALDHAIVAQVGPDSVQRPTSYWHRDPAQRVREYDETISPQCIIDYVVKRLAQLDSGEYFDVRRFVPLRVCAQPATRARALTAGALLERYAAATGTALHSIHAGEAHGKEVDLLEALARHRQVFLLGKSGVGKSALVRHLFERFSRAWRNVPSDLPAQWRDVVPLYGDLSHWNGGSLLDFLRAEINSVGAKDLAATLDACIKSRRVILVLDGLNELPPSESDGKREADPRIRELAKLSYDPASTNVLCLATSRTIAAGMPEWRELVVDFLTREQVATFAHQYYAGTDDAGNRADAFITEVYASCGTGDALDVLACRPFFLLRLLEFHEHRVAAQLQMNEAVLLQHAVERALSREVDRGILLSSNVDWVRLHLALLAFNMTDAGYARTVNRVLGERWLVGERPMGHPAVTGEAEATLSGDEQKRAEALLQWCKAADLLEVTPSSIQFTHQLFQDYFCALYLGGGLALLNRTARERFKEVWRLRHQQDSTLFDRLHRMLKTSERDQSREDAAKALGLIGDNRAFGALEAALDDRDMDVRIAAIWGLGLLGDPAAIDALIGVLRQGYYETAPEAASALEKIGRPALRPLLKTLNSLEGLAQESALVAIGSMGDERAARSLQRWSRRVELTTTAQARLSHAMKSIRDRDRVLKREAHA